MERKLGSGGKGSGRGSRKGRVGAEGWSGTGSGDRVEMGEGERERGGVKGWE